MAAREFFHDVFPAQCARVAELLTSTEFEAHVTVRDAASNLLFGIAVLSLAVIAGLTVRRELFGPGAGTRSPAQQRQVADWRSYASTGHRVGPDSATVTIVEYEDFECPVCGEFNRGPFKDVASRFPGRVAVVHKHWPLPMHRLAYPAARAAECASEQGRFEEYRQLLYDKQDSLGLKTFQEFAVSAGIGDLPRFNACYSNSKRVGVIEHDINEAKALGAHGTPTLMINGLMLVGAPDSIELERYIKQAIAVASRK